MRCREVIIVATPLVCAYHRMMLLVPKLVIRDQGGGRAIKAYAYDALKVFNSKLEHVCVKSTHPVF